jgi:hypothetical protein
VNQASPHKAQGEEAVGKLERGDRDHLLSSLALMEVGPWAQNWWFTQGSLIK